jgi:flagellar hook-associated protein FlgK
MSSIVRNQAVNIAAMLRTHHSDLTKLLENNLWELERSMETANNLIGRIVDYNAAITKEYLLDAGRIARGQGVSQYGPLEMLDQRNLLLDELAQFANIEVFQNNNGSVRVVMAGVTIIDDQESLQIRMLNYNDFNAAVMTFSNGVGFNPSTGEIRAYMEMVNGNGPYATGKYQTSSFGIPYYINALNVFAAEFAAIMNDTMNASLRASGFAYPPSTIDGVMRADNSNWERNLIWAGYEYMYNEDGSYRLDILGNRIRRTEEVQARDSAGRLMVYAAGEQMSNIDGQLLWFDTDGRHTTTNTGNQVLAVGGEPVMIRSYIRAEINASNIMISDEWLDNELMIGWTFDPNAGEMVRVRDNNGQPAYTQAHFQTQVMAQGTQQALRQATVRDANGVEQLQWHIIPLADRVPAGAAGDPPVYGIPTYDINGVLDGGWQVHPVGHPNAGEPVVLTAAQAIPIMIPAYQRDSQGRYLDARGDVITGTTPADLARRVPIMTAAFQRNEHGQYIDANGDVLGRFSNGNVVNPGARVAILDRPVWQSNSSGFLLVANSTAFAGLMGATLPQLINDGLIIEDFDTAGNLRYWVSPTFSDRTHPNYDGRFDSNPNDRPVTALPYELATTLAPLMRNVFDNNGNPIMLWAESDGAGGTRPAFARNASGSFQLAHGSISQERIDALVNAGLAVVEADSDGIDQVYVLGNVFDPTDADFDGSLIRVPLHHDHPNVIIDPTNGRPVPYEVAHYAPTGAWRMADLDGTNLQRFIRELEADRSWGNALDFNGCAFGKLQFISNRLAQGIEYTSHEFDMAMGTVQSLLDDRDAVSGVCETEEGIHMLKYQRWFNASARLMTTMDEALDTIINRMGRVGL